ILRRTKQTDLVAKNHSISLECQSHSVFTVSPAKVSKGRMMVYTCAVCLSAYTYSDLLISTLISSTSFQNTAILSSVIIITLVGMMVHIHFVKVDHETLLIIGSLGDQVSSKMGKIKDIVINEAIHMQTVVYFLCILLKDLADPNAVSCVVPLFQSSKLRLSCLVKVYKSCQEILAKC
uniref:Phosphatidylinositol glycan anchor biosynthesis, class H n=1 Tax=Salmo trutta TaxID=8032 RepID=A0A674D7Y4_SALTR